MIFDRTMEWGKAMEVISLSHFERGLRDRHGNTIHPGTGLTRPTVKAWLNALENAGAIIREGSCYGINREWNPVPVDLKSFQTNNNDMLRQPKNPTNIPRRGMAVPMKDNNLHKKGGKEIYPRGGKKFSEGGKEIYPLKGEEVKEENERTAAAAPQRFSGEGESELERNIQQAETRSAFRKERIAAETKIPPSQKLGRLFDSICAESFPKDTMPITLVDSTILRKFAQRFCRIGEKEREQPFSAFYEFLTWCIANWGLLMDNAFHWAKDAPPSPQVRFFVGMSEYFIRAWQSRKAIEARAGMTPKEKYIAVLRAKGSTQETAERAADQKFGDGQKEQMKKERLLLQRERTQIDLTGAEREKARQRAEASRDVAERIKKHEAAAALAPFQGFGEIQKWRDDK